MRFFLPACGFLRCERFFDLAAFFALACGSAAAARAAFAGSIAIASVSSSAPSRASAEIWMVVLAGGFGHVEIHVAHLAEDRQMRRQVGEVVVDLHHVLECGADFGQRVFEILECLDRLGAKIAGLADDLAADIEAELPGEIDDAARSGRLDHMGVAWRLGKVFGLRKRVCAAMTSPSGSFMGSL